MMTPYHSEKLSFQIIQLDPELEMQKKIVACSLVEAVMHEKRGNSDKYMNYRC